MLNAFILFFVLVVIGSATIWGQHADKPFFSSQDAGSEEQENAPPFTKAPDFSFIDLDGTTHRLSDFKGRGVIINFWASWCAPCVVELPVMLEAAQKTRQHAVFIFLSQDDQEEDMVRFLRKNGLADKKSDNVFFALDDKGKTASLFQTYKLPETYLIDRHHNITEKIIGLDLDWKSEEAKGKIEKLNQSR